MTLGEATNSTQMSWLVGIHVVFVVSAVMLALSDRISGDH